LLAAAIALSGSMREARTVANSGSRSLITALNDF
jgi:hypothetical protein